MQTQTKIPFSRAVLMGINIIVGAGIFGMTKDMTQAAGSMSFLGWPAVSLLIFPIIWSIVKASKIFKGDKGFYSYCAEGINPTAGFIAHWAYLLGYMSTAATLVTVLREACVSRLGWSFAAEQALIFNIAVIVFFTLLNLMPLSLISSIQSRATLLKMLPLFFVITIFAFYWNPAITYPVDQLGNLGMTVPFAIFAFWGFEACCSLSSMIEGGPSQVGKVILTAFIIASSLYTFFHLGLIHIMGVEGLATHGAAGFPLYLGLSPVATKIISTGIVACILLSYCNSIFGVCLANITNLFTMASNKFVAGIGACAQTNSYNRPITTAFIHAAIILGLLVGIKEMPALAALTNLGVCTAFVLTLVALFITYLKQKNYTQLIVTLVGFASCAVLCYCSWISISPEPSQRLIYAMPLFVGISLGLVLYKIGQMKSSCTPCCGK